MVQEDCTDSICPSLHNAEVVSGPEHASIMQSICNSECSTYKSKSRLQEGQVGVWLAQEKAGEDEAREKPASRKEDAASYQ